MSALRLDDFDGGFIIAPWDRFKELVNWYSTHLDLKVTYEEDHPVEKMATLTFPALGAIHVKSVEYDHPHFAADWGRNGSARFCFTAPDLDATLEYMKERQIETADIAATAFGRRFDFYDPVGNRLTAVEPGEGTEELLAKAPDARFPFQSLPRFAVSRLDEAVDWYERNLGGKTERISEDGKSAVVDICSEGCPVLLETDASAADRGRINAAARPYWVIRKKSDFFQTHERLKEQGFEVSDIAGKPQFLVMFHLHDPFGNQINVWSYEDC
jgi:Glyoxalase/Bleomycin resistance protein/Dioxygenase superfamily.